MFQETVKTTSSAVDFKFLLRFFKRKWLLLKCHVIAALGAFGTIAAIAAIGEFTEATSRGDL